MPEYPRLAGSVHLDHPGAVERERGATSRAYLSVSRGLKSGKLDEVELSREQLIDLIASAASALRVLERRG